MNPSMHDRLDQKAHARVFEEKIVPHSGLVQKSSLERPKAIILGGQPGAGKGSLARAAEAELHDDVVKIDPDALREFHPRINELRDASPYSWSSHTQADAGQWADELREAAVAGKKNLIFDTTRIGGPPCRVRRSVQ